MTNEEIYKKNKEIFCLINNYFEYNEEKKKYIIGISGIENC